MDNLWIISIDLVGGIATHLKNVKVNWEDDIPNIWIKHVPKHQLDHYNASTYMPIHI